MTEAEQPTLRIIGVPSGWGGRDPDAAHGPDVLVQGIGRLLAEAGVAWERTTVAVPGAIPNGQDRTETVAGICRDLAAQVADQIRAGGRIAVLGGDHSAAIGTWSGAQRGLGDAGELGLIWVDAHMDSHVPATSPSGALHGMPVATLLGHGDPRLTGVAGRAPALRPEHVGLIGTRSFEPAEAELLDRSGVAVYTMETIRRRGFQAVFDEALSLAGRAPGGFGISIDLDAFDPAEAPGVAVPAPEGLRAAEVLPALEELPRMRRFVGLELVEYTPGRDRDGRTAELARTIFMSCLLGRELP